MIRSLKDLEGFTIDAPDGPIGIVTDFYFDVEAWVIRYAVVDAGSWLGRDVLLSPRSMGEPDWGREVLPVNVTKKQVMNSPSIDTGKAIPRRYEKNHLGYYGHPYYWCESELPGTAAAEEPNADVHLRGCNAMTDYHVQANDGEIGHIQGFLVDDHSWVIRYIIVNSTNWWLGHHVLVSPKWVRDVSRSRSSVAVDLNRQAIKDAPAYDAVTGEGRDADVTIYNHYDRNGYWQDTRTGAPAQHA
jgi:hypothetical protein